ncbi:hypothetical protein SCLCIDRAFT_30949 [Scleroderma citrinum Foug A]|uniref:Uncharacterized protein n=1 Tax=Scleroderma citrinum Foug A TaxID=1036808 RepID=A0A0C2ZQ06_9AGAM|nr:hypothetical protein SCLCIDRAFT_30949 [Scleroderma citrinum Foug A]
MLSHFTYLKDAGFEFPANVQAMIILCKLPPTMEVVAQILSQTSPSEIKSLKPDGIVKAATLSFEQKGASHGASGKAPQANKLSAVKHKQADPKFAQQQQQPQRQQQQQGGSNGSGSGNAPAQGQGGRYRHGGKKAHARRERAQNAEFATYIRYKDGPVPTVDPRALAHTTGVTNYGPPVFDNTIKAFDLAHLISTASASLDQPKAGPSSLKRPRLKERIAMDVEEDTVSLGDEEEQPFIYEDFADSEFDDIDEMVLDRYNAVSMNLGAEASLFRQVPPARTLTHTDTLPLHHIFVRMRSMMRAVQTTLVHPAILLAN